MHQLIILGNGFDLTCGLKSKFSDFYGNRTNGSFSFESIPKDERNVWDVILSEIGQNDPLWCNIENLISAYVFQEDDSGSKLDHMYEQPMWTIDMSHLNQSEHPNSTVYNYVSTCLGKQSVSQKELTGFLLTSLKEYERIFARYLEEQVKIGESYRERL